MTARLIAVVLLMTAALVGAPPAGAADDPFYTPPALGEGRPGDLLKAEQVLLPMVAPPVRAWRIMYRSTGLKGGPIAVTGTLMVPLTAWDGPGERPIVSFAVGTRGVDDRCAPSKSLRAGLDYEQLAFPHALLKNWAVVISDMEGLGTPGVHTYVTRTNARQILDALRVVPKVRGAGLSSEAPVAVWGYSEGGHTAMSTAETAHTYAPELDLKGVAAGAVPADLPRVARYIDGTALAAAEFYLFIAYHHAYPELPWEGVMAAGGRAFLTKLEKECLAFDGIATAGGRRYKDLLTIDPIVEPVWRKRLQDNGGGQGTPQVPMFMYHSPADTAIPYDQAHDLFRTYCRAAVKVQWAAIPVPTHLGALIAGAPLAVGWLTERFAGEPAPSSC